MERTYFCCVVQEFLSQVKTVSPGMICFWLLVAGFFIQLFYHFYFFLRVANWKANKKSEDCPPVSLIICARNEDDNLVKNLPLIFSQEYPDFEVVVVNDCSYDNTGDVLEEFAKKQTRLKIVTIKEDEYYQHGKKVAVMMGIKGSKHEVLLFTDADCRPGSDQWLRTMTGNFSEQKEIVLGYGPYERAKGFLNKLIRFDSFMIGLQYLSFALAGAPYMGVGRNLAYRKKLFYKVKGFASHYHIPSGDDDLFVNEASNGKNCGVELSASTFCYSPAKKTFHEWWFQKRRHLETGSRYRFKDKFLLALNVIGQWIFFGGFIAALILQFQWYVVLGIFIFRLLVQMLIFSFAMKRLGERDLVFLAPLMEIILLFFYPVITVSRIFQRNRKWN